MRGKTTPPSNLFDEIFALKNHFQRFIFRETLGGDIPPFVEPRAKSQSQQNLLYESPKEKWHFPISPLSAVFKTGCMVPFPCANFHFFHPLSATAVNSLCENEKRPARSQGKNRSTSC
jgi:hypothetical protein